METKNFQTPVSLKTTAAIYWDVIHPELMKLHNFTIEKNIPSQNNKDRVIYIDNLGENGSLRLHEYTEELNALYFEIIRSKTIYCGQNVELFLNLCKLEVNLLSLSGRRLHISNDKEIFIGYIHDNTIFITKNESDYIRCEFVRLNEIPGKRVVHSAFKIHLNDETKIRYLNEDEAIFQTKNSDDKSESNSVDIENNTPKIKTQKLQELEANEKREIQHSKFFNKPLEHFDIDYLKSLINDNQKNINLLLAENEIYQKIIDYQQLKL